MKFNEIAPIIIYNVYCIELCIDTDNYHLENINENLNYHKIHGEFFYCDMVYEGQMIVSENFINQFIKKISLRLNVIDGNCVFLKIETE